MHTKLRAWLPRIGTILALLPAFNSGIAFCQQLAFSSRAYIQSPVVMLSVEPSKEFGFDSLVLRNDASAAIVAVHFQITFRTGAGDEIADERRVGLSLEPRDSRRIAIGLAHIESLRQLARSRKQASALVILTIESVEFQDGSEWKQTERDTGIPLDDQKEPREMRPRK